MKKKNQIHPKIMENIINWMLMPKKKLSYFGHFLSKMTICKDNSTKTMYVQSAKHGFILGYNKKYVDKTPIEEIRFVLLHEIFHCFNFHLMRIGKFNLKESNYAMDIVVNYQVENFLYSINEEIKKPKKLIEIPIKYNGPIVFESIYKWLSENKKKKNFDDKGLESLFERMEKGEVFDEHFLDESNLDIENTQYNLIKIHDSIKNENIGDTPGILKNLIQDIKKRKENPVNKLAHIMSETATSSKKRTFKKLNRKNIPGIKGVKKTGMIFNCIADVSGSMLNVLKDAIGVVTNSMYSMNLIKVDTKIQSHEIYNKASDLKKLEFKGAGGTKLQPGVDYIAKNKTLKKNGTIIITDGFIDFLDLSELNNVIIIYTSKKPPIKKKSKKYKEIKINVK